MTFTRPCCETNKESKALVWVLRISFSAAASASSRCRASQAPAVLCDVDIDLHSVGEQALFSSVPLRLLRTLQPVLVALRERHKREVAELRSCGAPSGMSAWRLRFSIHSIRPRFFDIMSSAELWHLRFALLMPLATTSRKKSLAPLLASHSELLSVCELEGDPCEPEECGVLFEGDSLTGRCPLLSAVIGRARRQRP